MSRTEALVLVAMTLGALGFWVWLETRRPS